jgi:cyclic beta-1,2-glucan synthetase
VEGILGIRREGDWLVMNPCIPDAWPGFTATVDMHSTRYEIRVASTSRGGPMHAVLDGEPVDCTAEGVRVPLDAGAHTLLLDLSVLVAALSES